MTYPQLRKIGMRTTTRMIRALTVSQLLSTSKNIFSSALDVLFPQVCLECGQGTALLCMNCLATIPRAEERHNDICTFPVISVFDYKHPHIRHVLLSLKFKRNTTTATLLGNALHDRVLEELENLSVFENFINPLIVPVPLADARLKARGYNQSALIAQEFMTRADKDFFEYRDDILHKIRETESQARTATRARRLVNLNNCFKVMNPHSVKKRNIIIFDDVHTTGATLEEAARTLRKAGARSVIGLTIAH